jgi:hypothetical protein
MGAIRPDRAATRLMQVKPASKLHGNFAPVVSFDPDHNSQTACGYLLPHA